MVSLIGSWEVGHTVHHAALSPDATRVAIATIKTVWIYDTHTGQKLVDPLEGHSTWVGALAFSPDGRTLASGSQDSTVRLWDTEAGNALVGPLKGHTFWVISVAFSLDGRFVISGSKDYTVRIWDARTGEMARGPIRLALQAQSLALLPDNRLAVCGQETDKNITVCDMDNCTVLFECVGHTSAVSSLSCSPNSRLLASGSVDSTIRFWDPASGEQIGQPLRVHITSAMVAGFSPDSRYLASSSNLQDSIRIWDTETMQMCGEPLPSYRSSVMDAAFTSAGNCLVSVYKDGAVKIWDLRALGISTETLDARAGITAQGPQTKVTSTDV
ncbi:hypothetical protein FRC12_021874 [Ceratobasidium sp. 428]|nr:hypothetical protein FRC12_021874 [Ceratobasidium sp. 428]